MSQDELAKVVQKVDVFARTSPEHKIRSFAPCSRITKSLR
jgi:hypothetical protein